MPFTKQHSAYAWVVTCILFLINLTFHNLPLHSSYKIHQPFTDYFLRLPYSELLEKRLFRSRANRRLVGSCFGSHDEAGLLAFEALQGLPRPARGTHGSLKVAAHVLVKPWFAAPPPCTFHCFVRKVTKMPIEDIHLALAPNPRVLLGSCAPSSAVSVAGGWWVAAVGFVVVLQRYRSCGSWACPGGLVSGWTWVGVAFGGTLRVGSEVSKSCD